MESIASIHKHLLSLVIYISLYSTPNNINLPFRYTNER